MGKQINFYFSDIDQLDFSRKVDALGGIVAAIPPFLSPHIERKSVTEVARWNSGEQDPIILRLEDAEKLIYRQADSGKGYFVDIFPNNIIVFSRSITTNEVIRRGRLYYIAGFFEATGEKFEKSKDFVEWTKAVFAVARSVAGEKKNGTLIGRDAAQMVKNGFKLTSI